MNHESMHKTNRGQNIARKTAAVSSVSSAASNLEREHRAVSVFQLLEQEFWTGTD